MRRLVGLVLSCLLVTACGGGGEGDSTSGPSQVLYVRTSGDDANSGVTPDSALKTIAAAAERLQPGFTVYVGAGRYVGRVTIAGVQGTAAQPTRLLVDVDGTKTGDPPGPVTIEAAGDLLGVRITRSPYVVLDGFRITGARPDVQGNDAAAIQVRSESDHVEIRNCLINNASSADGVRVQSAADVLLFNNLIYGNNRGVLVNGSSTGVRLVNNTIAGNRSSGIDIRPSTAAAPTGALLRNNIIQDSLNDISIMVSTGPPSALDGYSGDFNLSFIDGIADQATTYRPADIIGANDVNADAQFVNPDRGDFHLRPDSPAIDAGTDAIDPSLLEALLERSTSSGGDADVGPPDLGYHYLVSP